jgi:hypothetical protein
VCCLDQLSPPPILLKNTVLLAQKLSLQTQHERLFLQALLDCCGAAKIPLVHWLCQYPARQCLAIHRKS